jgi:ABC-type bacteriocin/lantibiotic exporter with double-glycine peptidase domain
MRAACESALPFLLVDRDLTCFAFVHRYFIDEGKVCESGTHDELLQKGGVYFAYVQLQK